MDTAKTIDLTHLYVQITNTVVFPMIHTEIQNRKHVNSKQKVLSNTMFSISRFQTTDIYRRTDRLELGIKIVLPNQLTMFAGILLKTF